METKRQKITAIFNDLRSEQEWGGSEDSDGALHPGTPNLTEAEDSILAILDEPDRPLCGHCGEPKSLYCERCGP